jgi:hypothetical protein
MQLVSFACAAALVATAALAADPQMPEMTPEQKAEMEAYMKAGMPGPPHNGLASTTGSYDVMVKHWHQPGAPAVEEPPGTVKRSMILGGRVMVEEFNGTMMGQPFIGHGMTGYDNVTDKYWSTWMDSMSTGMMLSEGTCDANNTCKFTGEHNDPISKKPMKMRMSSSWPNATTQLFEMWGPSKDGQEFKMMEITYKKK